MMYKQNLIIGLSLLVLGNTVIIAQQDLQNLAEARKIVEDARKVEQKQHKDGYTFGNVAISSFLALAFGLWLGYCIFDKPVHRITYERAGEMLQHGVESRRHGALEASSDLIEWLYNQKILALFSGERSRCDYTASRDAVNIRLTLSAQAAQSLSSQPPGYHQ